MPKEIGMLLLGVAIGTLIPALPPPADIVQPYLWIVLFILGIVLLIRG